MRPAPYRFRRARRGHPLSRSDLGLNAVVAVFFSMLTAAQGVHIYWDGTGTDWQAVASWSTLSTATSPDPSAVPGGTDIAHFNISTVNSAQTVNLNGDASAMGLVVLNTSTTTFQGGGTNRIFTLGSDGITMQSGAGAVTIGSATAGQFVSLLLGSSQFWTNESASALTVLNGVNLSSFRLDLAGSGGSILEGAVSGTGGISTTAGSTTLKGTNTYTGTTIVSGGTLTLDYSTNNTAKFAGALSLSGGTIDLFGGSYAQAATATTFGTGASSVTRTSGTSTLALGEITRTSGATANFTTGMASTTTGNTNGIVGPWATVGGTDWAQGTTSITAYTGYTTLTAAVDTPTVNYQLAGSLGPLTNTSVYTLKIAPSGSGQSLSISSGNSLSLNGLLVTGTDSYSITGGTLQPTTVDVAQELIVHQSNSGGLTISSVLANHGSGVYSLTKTGDGPLTLSGVNTYTGATTVTAGGLVLSSAGTLADTSALNLAGSSASFNLSGISAAGETIGSLTGLAGSTVVLGAKILTLGGDDSSPAAFPGVISGTGGVSKIGSGIQTVL